MKKVCVNVDSGICGFSCRIKAWPKEKRIAGIEISDSQCKMIQSLSTLMAEISFKEMFLPLTRNPIVITAERAGCHLACPVPAALAKAAEVALGLALPKTASIRFETDGGECSGADTP